MAAAIPAAISGIGGLIGQGGANKAADAAQNAALAQQSEAQRQYNEQSGIVNKATVAGLANYDKALKAQEGNLSRQEQLVKQIDPTIIEASQQALKLLRGEQSSTLAPLQNQRNMQRQKLVNSLREQLGPGAETSSAGQQALTRFDSESANIFSGAQQQAIQNLGSTFGQFSSGRPDILRQSMGLGQIGQSRADLSFGQANALQRFGQPLLQSAGAQYTADALKGKQQASFGNSLMGAGMQGLGAQFAGGGMSGGFDFGSLFGGGGNSAPPSSAGGGMGGARSPVTGMMA